MENIIGRNNKISDINPDSDVILREPWTKDNNNSNSRSKSKERLDKEDEEVTQLLLSSSAEVEAEDPATSSSSGSLPIKTKKHAQIVEARNTHHLDPSSSSNKNNKKGKGRSLSPSLLPLHNNNHNNNNNNHVPAVYQKRKDSIYPRDNGDGVNDIKEQNGPSSGLAVIIDVDPSNNNNIENNGELETVQSPSSLKHFKSFLSNTVSNTLTLTSVDSKLRQKFSSKFGRIRKRIVYKNGACNLLQTNISKRRRRYLADIFTTLVDTKWRFTLLVFGLSFILSWLFFAMIWWIIAFRHGDLEADHLPGDSRDPNWIPCVENFYSFTSAWLFSIETQHTIGYGSRYTTEECPDAIFVMAIQSILGVMIQALTVGIVFAKLSRPKKRTQTIVFSRHGVVCERDGELCLLFRVGDMRKSHIISATVRAHLIKRRVTKEGEVLPYYQHDLNVSVDDDQTQVFFIWPMVVVHKITKDSPLYNISSTDMEKENFEIVLILEGVIESTGATTQARTSYLPSEILWGRRFESMVSFRKDVLQYSINYTLFNSTYEIETPICSAKELDEMKKIQKETKKEGKTLLTPFRVGPATTSRRFSCSPVIGPIPTIPPFFEKKES